MASHVEPTSGEVKDHHQESAAETLEATSQTQGNMDGASVRTNVDPTQMDSAQLDTTSEMQLDTSLGARTRKPSAMVLDEDTQREALVRLKRTRAGHAADVTRKHSDLKCSLNQDTIEEAYLKLDRLKGAFAAFEEAHEQYMEIGLTLEPDQAQNHQEHRKLLEKSLQDAEYDVRTHQPRLQDTNTGLDLKERGSLHAGSLRESVCGSQRSRESTSSYRARAASRKAALLAKAECLQQQQAMEMDIEREMHQKELDLRQKKLALERLKLDAEIKAATAEEETLAMFLEDPDGISHSVVKQEFKTQAKELVPGAAGITTGGQQQYQSMDAMKGHHLGAQYQSMGATGPQRQHMPYAAITEENTLVKLRTGNSTHEVLDMEASPSMKTKSSAKQNLRHGTDLNQTLRPDAKAFTPGSPPKKEELGLIGITRALVEQMALSRLPAPEPTVFNGDPIKFPAWTVDFELLIERSGIPPTEKMYYLKKYLSGEAREAVEGFFLINTEGAYEDARRLLEQRYGDPFEVACAFRKRLDNWQKIGPSDGNGLRKLADFMQQCSTAMLSFSTLSILNDVQENQKLLRKLPDWVVNRWARQTREWVDQGQGFPPFHVFANFVSKEASIACDPVTSLQALRGSGPRESRSRSEAGLRGTIDRKTPTGRRQAFATKASSPEDLKSHTTPIKEKKDLKTMSGVHCGATTSRPKGTELNTIKDQPCPCCTKANHKLEKCFSFLKLTMDQREDLIMKKGLCFGCLSQGHRSKNCRARATCDTCGKRHPTSLHRDKPPEKPDDSKTANGDSGSKRETISTEDATAFTLRTNSAKTAMIVPVWISSTRSPSTEIMTYALLDTQSDSSFLLEDVARELQVEQQPVCLRLSTMTNTSKVNSSIIKDLVVRGLNQTTSVELNSCYTRDHLPVDRSHIPDRRTAEGWPHLASIASEMPVRQDCDVGLLIGYNCPQALAPRRTIVGKDSEPFAVYTDLGWSVVGSAESRKEQELVSQCYRVSTSEIPLPTVKEVLGILERDFQEGQSSDKAYSQEDLQFVEKMEKSITQLDDGHLQMSLPFRKRPKLPNNRKLAEIRLRHLQRKMSRNEDYRKQYMEFMKEIIDSGYAEKAPETATDHEVNYIPHHGVFHPKKKKIRVVFDCSAKFAGTSLNDHLLKGPDLINGLVGVLLRFRKEEVALICDIQKMFFQFFVPEDDRDYLRFLWWDEGDMTKDPVDYRMSVHLFGAASSPACANYGLKYLANLYKEDFPLAARFIDRDFYVDDGVTSAPNTEVAIKLSEEARELCKKGGLRLHKFTSNDRKVVESVPVPERAKEVMDLNLEFDDLPMERTLGVTWSPDSDFFCFKISLRPHPMTRRGILSTVASLYDPLGFVAPVVLEGKLILQSMCRQGIGWDEPIGEDLKPRWEQWIHELKDLEELRIPRCYHPADFGQAATVELHHFSDASMLGYGQCSYLRLINQHGDVHCSLVSAKARVAPGKITTIPRLELTAATVSAKMSVKLREELEYPEALTEYFWTDSMIVLSYINNEARRFHTFVANRIQMIKERTQPSQWRYVATEDNPADHASRGLRAADLSVSQWFSGPKFLWDQDNSWKHEETETRAELTTEDPEVKAVVFAGSTATEPPNLLENLKKISTWSKMVSVLTRIRHLFSKDLDESPVEEKRHTETCILKMVQAEAFSDEIGHLSAGKHVAHSSPLCSLNPYLDESGLIRVGGRLNKATLSHAVKKPIILPKASHVTQAILRHYHERLHHQGRGQTLNELRANGYWILSGPRAVADLVRTCVTCRRLRRPEEQQKMADLPEERLESSPPFTSVGIDCFGPFLIKKGRSEVKRYGLLFTCLFSRAVHVEMLEDMSTDSFINGLRCFVALRGAVRVIRCDQGTNFVGADNELKSAWKEMDPDRVKSFLLDIQCDFIYNAPHASHAGGIWERQIRTIREVLKATIELCPNRLDDSSLRTLFYEAMAIVNSRPLVTASVNDPESDPITPNHLLTMKPKILPPPPGCFVREDMYARKRWRRVQYLSEQFWSRWRREYILNLQQRQKWHTPRRNITVGDVVLLKDDSPRMQWPLGIVISVTQDDDGLVRRVWVRVASRDLDKKGRPTKVRSELERPVQKLVLLKEAE